MPDLSLQRRLASEILGVGVNNVRFDPERIEDIERSFRREEIKALIEDGAIYAVPPSRNSRGRWKIKALKRRKGRRRGHGSRKGSRGARADDEALWVYRVRKQRAYIRRLKEMDVLDVKTYRQLYMKIKGGAFKDLASLKAHLRALGILKS